MKGFTLVELLIVLVIAGILTTFGVPAFTTLVKDNRLSSDANRLAATIKFARSEAVKRNQIVTIARAGGTVKAWENGWSIFVDVGGEGNEAFNTTGGDILLRQAEAAEFDVEIRSNTVGQSFVSYQGDGTVDNTGDIEFRVCDDRGPGKGKKVDISLTGRVITGAISSGNCTP